MTRPAKPWFPSAQELRRATSARDNTTMTADDAARLLKIPVDWMRAFYAEGRAR